MSGSLIPLAFFPKVVSDILSFLPFSSLIYTPVMIIVGNTMPIRFFRRSLCSFLALSDGGLVSVDLETSPVLYHHSREVSMKKYQRMHLIFIRQYIKANHGYKVRFCRRRVRSLSDSRLEPLVSQCHLSTHPIPRRLDFSRNRLYLWLSLIPKGLDHLFLIISGR